MKCVYCGEKLVADPHCNLGGTLRYGKYHPENRDGYMTKVYCGNFDCAHGYFGFNSQDKKRYEFQVFDPQAKIQEELTMKEVRESNV